MCKAVWYRKKRRICDENLFLTDNVEWRSKNLWKMISSDLKANKTNKK